MYAAFHAAIAAIRPRNFGMSCWQLCDEATRILRPRRGASRR